VLQCTPRGRVKPLAAAAVVQPGADHCDIVCTYALKAPANGRNLNPFAGPRQQLTVIAKPGFVSAKKKRHQQRHNSQAKDGQ
jgi:hypothetical protein